MVLYIYNLCLRGLSMSDNIDEKLDSPLVVHKETDASYEENNTELDVNITHIDEDTVTLERHRFKKVKKKSKAPYVFCAVLIIIAVFAGLYFGGVIPKFFEKDETTVPVSDGSESTTEENRFKGIITVKGTYLFFEGKEINGTEDLISEIKYANENTSFIIQDENADSTFLNDEILPILTSYNIQYEVKYIVSSGLMSVNETTASDSTAQTQTAENGAE